MVDLRGDIVLRGIKVWTPGLAWEALADELHLRGGKVVGIAREGAIRGERVAQGKEVQLPGEVVMPPFFDAHLHLDLGGRFLSRVQLNTARDADAVLNRLSQEVSRGDGWVIAIGMSEHAWPDPFAFHKATAGRPVIAMARDYHSAYVNREGMRELGLSAETELPEGGWQDMDDAGQPLGILHENAMRWVEDRLPKQTDEEAEAELLLAQRHLLSMGVLGVSDASDTPAWASLRSLADAEKLYLRVEHWHRCLSFGESCINLEQYKGERLLRHRLKSFLDGALGSKTAWMMEDYSDDPGNRGEAVPDLEEYLKFLYRAVEAGWSHTVHAIGDAAVEWASRELPKLSSPNGVLHRLEHIQHIDIDSLKRIHHGDLIASLQPLHRVADHEMLVDRIGINRAALSFPQRSLMKGGRGVVLGSDWPVVSADPRQTLLAAISPRSLDEGMPGEELPLEAALEAMTFLPAEAAGFSSTGRLEAGYDADFLLVEKDPGFDPSGWRELKIENVWSAGRPLLHK